MCKSCAALLIILLLAPSTVCAHAYLVKSVPAQRAVLFRAPAKIQLWFNERLEPRYSSFTVSDAEGKAVDIGKAEVSGDDLPVILRHGNGNHLVRPRQQWLYRSGHLFRLRIELGERK